MGGGVKALPGSSNRLIWDKTMKIAQLLAALANDTLVTDYMGVSVNYNSNWVSAVGEKIIGFKAYTGPEVFPEESHFASDGSDTVEMLDPGTGAVVAKCEDGLFEAIFEEVDVQF